MTSPRPLVILVHPGSLCGSADANLGDEEACRVRDEIISFLDDWEGDVLALQGFLSDELPSYPDLNSAMQDALDRASEDGLGISIFAEDPDHPFIALMEMESVGVDLDTPILVTGAWYDPSGLSGCVNSTVTALKEAGYTNVKVESSVAQLEFWADEDEEERQTLLPYIPPKACLRRAA